MNKGPLIILFMGIGTMVFFGVVANWLVGNNPIIQEMADYRREVEQAFPVERAVLSHNGADYQLTLWTDEERLGEPIPARDQLPAVLVPLRRHFVTRYPGYDNVVELEVLLLRTQGGWGCQGAEEQLCSARFQIRQEVTDTKKAVATTLRATVSVITFVEGKIVLAHVRGRPTDENVQKAAVILTKYLGGGWKEIQFRINGELTRFDGRAKKIPA